MFYVDTVEEISSKPTFDVCTVEEKSTKPQRIAPPIPPAPNSNQSKTILDILCRFIMN